MMANVLDKEPLPLCLEMAGFFDDVKFEVEIPSPDDIRHSVEDWQRDVAEQAASRTVLDINREQPQVLSPSAESSEHGKLAESTTPVTGDETLEVIQQYAPLSPVSSSPSPSGNFRVEIPESTLLTPRSCYEPFEPAVPISSERSAIQLLLDAFRQQNPRASDVEFMLDDFAVYCDKDQYPLEMKPLQLLGTKYGYSNLFVDGILSVGEAKFFVRRARISAMPIGNYGALEGHTVRHDIWLQSELSRKQGVYYRLRSPAKEYQRFFTPFLWIADLAKHFVDFLQVSGKHNRKVSIHSFRTTFETWLRKVHTTVPDFVHWLDQHSSTDFRTSVVANLGFLHKEAVGVLGKKAAYYHTIWSQALDFSKQRPQHLASVQHPPTVVTQYIYDCFEHLPFGDQLQPVTLSQTTQKLQDAVIEKRHLELPSPLHSSAKDLSIAAAERVRNIQPGDTVSTPRDDEDSGTKWERETAKGFDDVDRWFALVQKVSVDRRGHRIFDVIWYYRAVDTLCGLMKYPWNNELFLSDHCSCQEDCKITEDQVLGVHEVDFGGASTTLAEFFCRQTYLHEERKWITLREEHQHCEHTSLPVTVAKYQPGDTVLARLNLRTAISEPCEVVANNIEGPKLLLRRLRRRGEVNDGITGARPNELVYTDEFVELHERRITELCYVRVFPAGKPIPCPYNRDGVGALFYITHRAVTEDSRTSCVPMTAAPISLRQSFDPGAEVPKLRGLDLFCGGGNFGRGLEDGGGIEMKWANDFNKRAIHTYMANVGNPDDFSPFLGSIDDLQRLAIQGRFSQSVPRVGDVDFISAGSPCPGFSNLTNDKTTVAQRKNQSLVAAFASFVDLYRPLYGLLENVPGIVQSKSNRHQDVFSQLICAIVGLGYQTQFFFLDASSCGSPQRRSRVFLAFAAPGLTLPRRPAQTHSYPEKTASRSIGKLPNGEPMAVREMSSATPFSFVTAAAATADLPPIQDAKADACIAFPDHRLSIGQTKTLRSQMGLIPTRPWGMNFASAWYGMDRKKEGAGTGVLTAADRAVFPADRNAARAGIGRTLHTSNAYGRQMPNRLMETVTTRLSTADAKAGRQLHWRENRALSVMEVRRAQGFRDNEVLLGSPSDQYKIVGNSVAREPAVALGLVFRDAWLGSLREAGNGDIPILQRSSLPNMVVDDSTSSDSATNVTSDADDGRLSLARGSSSPTPATTITESLTTSSTAPLGPLVTNRKRLPQSSLVVEILASKISKTRRSASPGSAAAEVRAAKEMRELLRPNPLAQAVIVISDDEEGED